MGNGLAVTAVERKGNADLSLLSQPISKPSGTNVNLTEEQQRDRLVDRREE